ncbi:MAG: hypothetical protein GY748_02540 [Planctomycetaceae bacterium]|nr:hypothetical protein [Planctomycetaceae bacterium]
MTLGLITPGLITPGLIATDKSSYGEPALPR